LTGWGRESGRCGLRLVRGGFFQKPPLTRFVALPFPQKPAGFDGVGTGVRPLRTVLSSRRLFSKASSHTFCRSSFPAKVCGFWRGEDGGHVVADCT